MLLRLVLILTLALQPLAGVASVATDCPSRSRLLSVSPICTTTDEPCCSGEQTVSRCCQIAAEPAEPGCPCSESVCPTILGHECGSCGCHPDRPAQPLSAAGDDDGLAAQLQIHGRNVAAEVRAGAFGGTGCGGRVRLGRSDTRGKKR